MQKKLLSRREAGTYSGLTLYMIDRLIKEGELLPARVHGRVYIHRELLDQWIDARAMEGGRHDDDQ